MSLLYFSTPSRQLYLSTLFFLTSSSTDVLTPFDTSICRELLRLYIFVLREPVLISSICPHLFIFQTLSLSLQTCSPVIFQAFSSFPSLGKLLFSFIYMHFMFWNLGLGVFENFWGFSKLMSYCWNFEMGFAYMILKLHALHHTCIITIFSCI